MTLPLPRFMVRASQRRAYEVHENARDPRRAERHRLDALFLDMHRQREAADKAERVQQARRDPDAFVELVMHDGVAVGLKGPGSLLAGAVAPLSFTVYDDIVRPSDAARFAAIAREFSDSLLALRRAQLLRVLQARAGGMP